MSPAGKSERLRLCLTGKSWPGSPPLLGRLEFALGEGEVVALCGPSGCGKSTLLSIAAGLDRGFCGSLYLGEGFASPWCSRRRVCCPGAALPRMSP